MHNIYVNKFSAIYLSEIQEQLGLSKSAMIYSPPESMEPHLNQFKDGLTMPGSEDFKKSNKRQNPIWRNPKGFSQNHGQGGIMDKIRCKFFGFGNKNRDDGRSVQLQWPHPLKKDFMWRGLPYHQWKRDLLQNMQNRKPVDWRAFWA